MAINLENKINKELEKFKEKMKLGFNPIEAFSAFLPRILKEQDRDTRHACAQAVLKSENLSDASEECINTQTFEIIKTPKKKY